MASEVKTIEKVAVNGSQEDLCRWQPACRDSEELASELELEDCNQKFLARITEESGFREFRNELARCLIDFNGLFLDAKLSSSRFSS
jgi:hypothetical protein